MDPDNTNRYNHSEILGLFQNITNGMAWAVWSGFWDAIGYLTKDQLRKTLWDWMQWLIIALILALAGLWFSGQQKRRKQNIEKGRQLQTALQAYLDQMKALLLDSELLKKKDMEDDPTLDMAKIQTVTALRNLDMERRNILLRFLLDAGLSSFVLKGASLANVDLSGANLSYANLSKADLSKADLSGADLSGADLSAANLSEADLSMANLSEANLNGADLSGAMLIQANLNDADLSEVKYDEDTFWAC